MRHATRFAAAMLLAAALSQIAAAALATHTVTAVTADRVYVAEGVVEAVRQSAVASQVPARINEIRARAGDTVKAGQVLVRLDPRAASDLLVASRAQAAAAQAQLDAARRDFERNRRLYEKSYISAAAMEQAEAQFKAAQAQAQATMAQAGVASTQSTFTTLTAPYSGIVASVNAEVGDLATPGTPIMTVYDPTELRVVAQLPESHVRELAATAPVRVAVAGGSDASQFIAATRMVVLPTADASTHMRQVRLALPADAKGATPGMFARASFPLGEARTAQIAIPLRSIVRRPEFAAVYVVDGNGRAQLRQVRLGRASGENVEVLSGLAAGDRIAVDPVAAAAVGR